MLDTVYLSHCTAMPCLLYTFGNEISKEIRHMNSVDEVNSVLRSQDASALELFSWNDLAEEAKTCAPKLYTILLQSVHQKCPTNPVL